MDENSSAHLLTVASPDPSELAELKALVVDISPEQVSSPALQRLLEEVRDDPTCCLGRTYAFDRTHNKHNRGK